MNTTFNKDKFRNMILYFADKSKGDPHFGAVKLNKLLFFSDFFSYGFRGESISGAKYIHLAQGPGASQMIKTQYEMEKNKQLRIDKVTRLGFTRHVPVAITYPDDKVLSAEEREICDMVLEDFREHTSNDVSNLSHTWSGWIHTSEKEEIPYETVFVRSCEPVTKADTEWAEAVLKKHSAVSVA